MKWELIKKSLITTIALGAVGLSVSAQEDPLLNVTNNIVSTDQIDVDGLFNKPKQVSEADKIQHLRRQLEQKHEQMMRKKVEDMRLEEERKIARKLQKALSGQLKAMDSVSSTQSAVQKVEVKAPAPKEDKPNKFSLSGGFMSYSGEQEVDASLNIKAAFETDVSSNFAVGMSVRYVSVEMQQNNNFQILNPYSTGYYGNGYYNGYNQYGVNNTGYNNFNQNYKFNSFAFTVHSKYYFTKESRIRPYLGAGLNYNRGTMKNDDNQDNQQYYSVYGIQTRDVSVNNLGASVLAGGEVMFNDMFAFDLYVQYDRSFTSSVEDEFNDTTNETILKNLARDLEESNVFSINAGVSFFF
ncbi:MAG: OmpW family outer membrane protein [Bdellovibrionota bacterium]|nr:OmpW family outer membrane protein [Bdellovibrionota bacterium]